MPSDIEEYNVSLSIAKECYSNVFKGIKIGLRREVLEHYRRYRKSGDLPSVAMACALYDWDL